MATTKSSRKSSARKAPASRPRRRTAPPSPPVLYLTSPQTAGTAVLALQEQLRALGYSPGRLDGVYGDATAGAVRAFQRDAGIAVDGIVGRETRAALARAAAAGRPSTAAGHAPSAVGLRALATAVAEVGTRESPPGSNRTKYGRWFGIDGVRWCNVFVSYCFAIGADYVLCEGLHADGVYPHGCTYVPTTEAWLRAAGHWVGRTDPLPGDIVIYDFGAGPHHIGIVEAGSDSAGAGTFDAIEGNTAVGDDCDGGMVMRRRRYMSQVAGFGRIRS